MRIAFNQNEVHKNWTSLFKENVFEMRSCVFATHTHPYKICHKFIQIIFLNLKYKIYMIIDEYFWLLGRWKSVYVCLKFIWLDNWKNNYKITLKKMRILISYFSYKLSKNGYEKSTLSLCRIPALIRLHQLQFTV